MVQKRYIRFLFTCALSEVSSLDSFANLTLESASITRSDSSKDAIGCRRRRRPRLLPAPAPVNSVVYKPKDFNRDWLPRFSTLRDKKNGWIQAMFLVGPDSR